MTYSWKVIIFTHNRNQQESSRPETDVPKKGKTQDTRPSEKSMWVRASPLLNRLSKTNIFQMKTVRCATEGEKYFLPVVDHIQDFFY